MSTDLNALFDAMNRGDTFAIVDQLFPQDPQQPRNRTSFAPVEGSSPTDDAGTAGVVHPVTCRARYYDAASRILEDELHLFTHANCNKLGAHIQQWIERTHDNWEPR